MKIATNIASELVAFYIGKGMSDRLAESILVCRYLETMLDGIDPLQTGRIQPVFDYDLSQLKDDWRRVRWFDLWLDTSTGRVVRSLPASDGEPDLIHIHLPEDVQRRALFGRWAHLFH